MILYLGNKLSKHGFNPTSVETLGNRMSELGYTVVAKSSFKSKVLRLFDMVWAVLKFRKKKPLIFIDTYSTSAFWFAVIIGRLARFYKLRYVPILRGGDLPHRLNRSPRLSEALFSYAYKNISTSGYLHHEFNKRNFKVDTISNYIDIKNYPFKVRETVAPKLLWVRAFHEIYNPQMALKVLMELKKHYPEASLCMVGPDKDGSMKQCKQIASEMQLDVTFTGKLLKEEWIKLSADYSFFINTTNVDNTPVSVMEAMALGMPVVSTNAGGIPFLFQNGSEGIIVGKENALEMSNAIEQMLTNKQSAGAISNAARLKAEQWDWSVVKIDWINLIETAKHN